MGEGVSVVVVRCDRVSPPVCTYWVFLSQEEGVYVSCLISVMGKSFFVSFSYLCMCGGLSMLVSLLLSFVPCVSSTVFVIFFVVVWAVHIIFQFCSYLVLSRVACLLWLSISMSCNLLPQSRSACRHCCLYRGVSM